MIEEAKTGKKIWRIRAQLTCRLCQKNAAFLSNAAKFLMSKRRLTHVWYCRRTIPEKIFSSHFFKNKNKILTKWIAFTIKEQELKNWKSVFYKNIYTDWRFIDEFTKAKKCYWWGRAGVRLLYRLQGQTEYTILLHFYSNPNSLLCLRFFGYPPSHSSAFLPSHFAPSALTPPVLKAAGFATRNPVTGTSTLPTNSIAAVA